jgi:hypothetical protein
LQHTVSETYCIYSKDVLSISSHLPFICFCLVLWPSTTTVLLSVELFMSSNGTKVSQHTQVTDTQLSLKLRKWHRADS